MGLYDRDYMRSGNNSWRAPEEKGKKISDRKALAIAAAIIMVLIFIIAYVI